jgi:alkylation response protein AidB-like acyl-CoA dehydrogenase
MSDGKMWGGAPYYGLDYDFDPQWLLTDEQKEIQRKLIDLCHSTLRPNAIESDKTLEYPRKNMEALASQGLLALHVPKKYGGMGQNHTCVAMVLETIGRYGCPSTALVYSMHLLACSALLFRAGGNKEIEKVMRRLNKDVFIGTCSYSDPETGSHFWYPMASRAERVANGWKVNKKSSWTTSGGFADFYVAQTSSPDFNGDFSNLSVFLMYADEVKAQPATWDAMGMRGNQSGPITIDNVVVPADRMVGPPGDGAKSNDEALDPIGLIVFAASYNGMALGMIDIAKKQTTSKTHADVGMRVADYPTIQDYVGDAIMDTQASRLYTFSIAKLLDDATENCDWTLHERDPNAAPRTQHLTWSWKAKYIACKNVYSVGDRMLWACGGSGYKRGLEIERLFRDSRAGWVMGPTNEVLRQFVGKWALLGLGSLDYWNQAVNERVLNNEIKKMDADGKRRLIEKLSAEIGGAKAAR